MNNPAMFDLVAKSKAMPRPASIDNGGKKAVLTYLLGGSEYTVDQLANSPEARRNGLKKHTIRGRLNSGWPAKRAISKPCVKVKHLHHG